MVSLLVVAGSAATTPVAAKVNLRDLQNAIRPVVEQARKSTVAVSAMGSTGSGVVVSRDGLILTAGHVVTVDMMTGEVVEEVSVLFQDGDERRARVLGINRTHDAAMLKLIGEGPWDFSPLGSSTLIRPGEWVVATGHPSGYDALRDAPVRFGRVISKNVDFFFGSDCVIFGGDSGGPLFDLDGKVVGIHSWIGESVQINTHAGISGFLADWERLEAGERWGILKSPPRQQAGTPILGVTFAPGRGPVILDSILTESPAERAGLRKGDVVLRMDGKRVDGDIFPRYLASLKVGDEVVLEVQRGGEDFISRVELGRVTALPFVTESAQKKLEAQAGEFFQAFGEVADNLGAGAVRIFGERRQLAFGTVWKDGRVLSKWSELENARRLIGIDSQGKQFGLSIDEVFQNYDLAVLTVDGETSSQGIPIREESALAGTLIAAVRPDGVPEGIGVVSVRDRSLLESSRGFLGVMLDIEYQQGGALVSGVNPDSPAEEVGLRAGDIIYRVNDRKIDGFDELKTILSRAGPGQEVNLTVRRPDGEVQLTPTLTESSFRKSPPDNRERMMDRMDNRGLSRVRSHFPKVLQSDMTIVPEECGLPVVDIEGRLVGMVLARAGRVKTYLLSAETLTELLEGVR
jgi:serine protease Do